MFAPVADSRARLRSVCVIWLLMLFAGTLFTLLFGNSRLTYTLATSEWAVEHQQLVRTITDFGVYPFYFLFLGILGAGWLRGNAYWRLLGWGYLAAQLIGSVLIVRTLKMLTGHARPATVLSGITDTWVGPTLNGAYHSFPSGHTADLFTSTIFLAALLPRVWQRVAVMSFAVIVGITRIILLKHFPLDTLVGAIIGGIVTLLILRYRVFPVSRPAGQ